MDYRALTAEQQAAVIRDRMARLEAAHLQVSMDLEDAEREGEDDTAAAAREKLESIERQLEATVRRLVGAGAPAAAGEVSETLQ